MKQDAPQVGELLSVALAHPNEIIDEYVESAKQSFLEGTIRNGVGQVGRSGGSLSRGAFEGLLGGRP
jgi:hypothetical protein